MERLEKSFIVPKLQTLYGWTLEIAKLALIERFARLFTYHFLGLLKWNDIRIEFADLIFYFQKHTKYQFR